MDELLSSLKLWFDPIPRSGSENMAVDDWLLEASVSPVLRIYEWNGSWGSLGCFCCFEQTLEFPSGIRWVRRSTGGGLVDHQDDWTYSFFIPTNERLAQIRAKESYRVIHQTLASVLSDRFNLLSADITAPQVGGVCFQKPVVFDVIDDVGNKIAGAGQRRTKNGLLHQGSVACRLDQTASMVRSKRLASAFFADWEQVELQPPPEWIGARVAERYGNPDWTERR